MKQSLILFSVLLLISNIAFSQAANNSLIVPVNGSYVTITKVDVYPYDGTNSSITSKKMHFKLNKGTKFFIDKVIDDGSTTVGYVITPWRFKEEKLKTDFFKEIRNKRSKYYKDLANAQAALDKAKENFKRDSLSLDSAKVLLSNNQAALKDATNLLIEAKTIKPSIKKSKKIIAPGSEDFANAQNHLKAELIKSNTLIDSSKAITNVLSKIKAPTQQLEKITNNVINMQNAANKAQEKLKAAYKKIETTTAELNIKKTSLFSVIKEHVSTVKVKGAKQTNSDRTDTVFNITKGEINEHLDTVEMRDTSSLVAKYEDLAFVDAWANHWQFFITSKDFTANCVSIYPHSNKFSWGFLTLPIKLRFDNNNNGGRFKFEQNLNFGLTFGDKMQIKSINDVSFNFLAGISVVNVQLNNATLATETTPAIEATSTPAVSMSIGTMLQYNQFQIGIFAGRDFAGDHASEFAYQGKPWIGFAIGLSLFGASKTSASAQSQ